jgi:hypothetical protein
MYPETCEEEIVVKIEDGNYLFLQFGLGNYIDYTLYDSKANGL